MRATIGDHNARCIKLGDIFESDILKMSDVALSWLWGSSRPCDLPLQRNAGWIDASRDQRQLSSFNRNVIWTPVWFTCCFTVFAQACKRTSPVWKSWHLTQLSWDFVSPLIITYACKIPGVHSEYLSMIRLVNRQIGPGRTGLACFAVDWGTGNW